jgi:general secretion pathway protein G
MRMPQGFTLIELVITLAIVALLATAAAPLVSVVIKREHEAELRVALRQIREAIDAYKLAAEQGRIQVDPEKTGYPPDLDALVNGVEDQRNPKPGVMIYFLRRIPRDPLYPDGTSPASASWGLRSYASSPEDPQPGDDVYDVYPLSNDKGLNGVPYREW